MDIFTLLEAVQAIARTGLRYTENHYDRERYGRLLDLAVAGYAAELGVGETAVRDRFRQELGTITPKIGADAAIFNENGEILLMERVDGTGWCLPCGWVEANERPIDAMRREVWEETGLQVTVQRLVGVFTRQASAKNGPHTMVAIVHLCKISAGTLTLSPEGLALRYWRIEDVLHWHPNHDKYARAAFKMWAADHLLPAISD